MPAPLMHLLVSIRQMMQAADIDHTLLVVAKIDSAWLADYANQRIVNSFLFNYIKIQDKIGSKLFRLLLQHWREDQDGLTMLDMLNRLEKLHIIQDVETWDKLREIRNDITHEYPQDIEVRIGNIRMALSGYEQLKAIISNIEQALQLQASNHDE
ncbi:hypothetical protein D5125_14985 [Magnetovirga frankeli]|uniref:hypothetical protein n=2 Tax=Magnetovirga frankeli TaxID=947516 RepID=UPI0012937E7E|nr:hypothetical protein D5125_14985 [gamma proteobacterium SS-5]